MRRLLSGLTSRLVGDLAGGGAVFCVYFELAAPLLELFIADTGLPGPMLLLDLAAPISSPCGVKCSTATVFCLPNADAAVLRPFFVLTYGSGHGDIGDEGLLAVEEKL